MKKLTFESENLVVDWIGKFLFDSMNMSQNPKVFGSEPRLISQEKTLLIFTVVSKNINLIGIF